MSETNIDQLQEFVQSIPDDEMEALNESINATCRTLLDVYMVRVEHEDMDDQEKWSLVASGIGGVISHILKVFQMPPEVEFSMLESITEKRKIEIFAGEDTDVMELLLKAIERKGDEAAYG